MMNQERPSLLKSKLVWFAGTVLIAAGIIGIWRVLSQAENPQADNRPAEQETPTPSDVRKEIDSEYSGLHFSARQLAMNGDYAGALKTETAALETVGQLANSPVRLQIIRHSLEFSALFAFLGNDLDGSIQFREGLLEILELESRNSSVPELRHAVRLQQAILREELQIRDHAEKASTVRARRLVFEALEHQFHERPWKALDCFSTAFELVASTSGEHDLWACLARARWLELKLRYGGVQQFSPQIDAVEESLRKYLGPDHLQVISLNGIRATFHEVRGEARDMARQWQDYADLARPILGPSHPSIARALMMQGFGLSRNGEFIAAGHLLEEAETIYRKLQRGLSFEKCLLNYYRFDWYLGQEHQARVIADAKPFIDYLKSTAGDAPDWNSQSGNSRSRLKAALQSRLAAALLNCPYDQLVEFAATQGFVRATPTTFRMSDEESVELARIQDDHVTQLLEDAAATLSNLDLSKSPENVWVLVNRCVMEMYLKGKLHQADQLAKQSIEIYEELTEFGVAFQLPRLLYYRAEAARYLEQPREALGIHQRAVELSADNSLGDALKAINLRGMAVAWYQLDNKEEALDCIQQCIDLYEVMFLPSIFRQDGIDATQNAGQLRRRLRDLIKVTDATNREQVNKLFEYVTRIKAIVSRTIGARARFSGTSKTDAWVEQLRDVTRQLSAARLRNENRQQIETLEKQKRSLTEKIGVLSGNHEFRFETDAVQRLEKVMPYDVVFVELYWLQATDFVRKRKFLAFVLTNDSDGIDINLVDLGSAAEIDDDVDSIYADRDLGLFAKLPRGIDKDREKQVLDFTTAMQHLKTRVWDRIEPYFGDRKQIVMCGDGSLGRVAWSELPGSAPGQQLLDEYLISAMPTVRELIGILEAPPSGHTTALAVGGVEYGKGNGLAGIEFGYLPESLREIQQYGDLLAPVQPLMRTARDATEQEVCALLPTVGTVYFATHGHILDYRFYQRNQQPFSDCVLVLSDANDNQSGTSDDGLLSGEEIVTMDLRNLNFAIVSACRSGGGSQVSGEGITGIQRALLLAGARSCLASNWSMDDKDALQFMHIFIQAHYQQQESKVQALRTAQMKMRELHPQEPARWANWQLAGDWR